MASSINAFDILLRYVVDKRTLQQIKDGTLSINEALQGQETLTNQVAIAGSRLQPILEAQEKEAGRLQLAWWRAQRELRAAQFVFTAMAAMGGAIMTPLIAAVNGWATEMTKAGVRGNETLDRWTAAQAKLKEAQLSVGQTAAEVLIPVYEKLAELATKGADYLEKNPEVVGAALKLGTALVAVAAIGTLVTTGIKLYVDVKFVTASATNLLSSQLAIQAAKANMVSATAMMAAADVYAAASATAGATSFAVSKLPPAAISLGGGRFRDPTTGRFVSGAAAAATSAARDKALLAETIAAQELTAAKASLTAAEMAAVPVTGLKAVVTNMIPILTKLGIAAAALALAYGAAWIGLKAGNEFMRNRDPNYKDQTFEDVWNSFKKFQVIMNPLRLTLEGLVKLGVPIEGLRDKFTTLLVNLWGLNAATEAVARAAEEAAASQKKNAEGYAIIRQLEEDNLAASLKYEKERLEVIQKSDKEIASANTKLQKSLKDASTSLHKALNKAQAAFDDSEKSAGIKYQAELTKMAQNYRNADIKAAQDHTLRRAEIIANGEQEILDLEEAHQQKLLELQREHDDNVYTLLLNRDALGLSQENRRFDLARADEENATNRQIAQKNKEIATRLKQEQMQYNLSQQQRRADYALQLTQAAEQYKAEQIQRAADFKEKQDQAKEDYKERVREATLEHQQDVARLRAERAAKLIELQNTYIQERNLRIQAAYTDLVALGGALKAEALFKQQYQALMLKDVEAFVIAYRAGLAKLADSPVPAKAAGGYASDGFVATHATTLAAERLLGGRLTQQSFLTGGSSRGSLTINDHRTFDSRLSVEDRNQIAQFAVDKYMELLAI